MSRGGGREGAVGSVNVLARGGAAVWIGRHVSPRVAANKYVRLENKRHTKIRFQNQFMVSRYFELGTIPLQLFINLPAGNKVGSETEEGAAINKITINLT